MDQFGDSNSQCQGQQNTSISHDESGKVKVWK